MGDEVRQVNMKTQLGFSIGKVTLAFALFVITGLLWRSYVISTISDTFPVGFPLQFYFAWGPCPLGEMCSEFNWLWLIIDIVFWYVVSVFIISKLEKRTAIG